MTNFIVDLLIKDKEDVKNPIVRKNYGMLAGCIGIFCNIILFLSKLFIGTLSGSVSITADAVNNLSDASGSFVSLISFKLSSKAPDRQHPFGYGRIEYIASLILAFLIVLVGFELFKTGIEKIIKPAVVDFSPSLVIVLLVSIAIKLWMGMFNLKIGRIINSTVLMATMQDSINDVIATTAVLSCVLLSYFTSFNIDGYVAMAVSIFIIYSGFNIARETLSPIIGQCADPETVKDIKDTIMGFDYVLGVHDLIVHNYGQDKCLASIHVEVPDNVNFVKIHEIVDAAEKAVWQNTGIYIVIHMDPVNVDDKRIDFIKDQIHTALSSIDSSLSMHDLRIVDSGDTINLIFDVVLPFGYSDKAKSEFTENLAAKMKQYDKSYNCVITLDHEM